MGIEAGWLKPRQAAAYAGVSPRTVRSWLKAGLRHARLPSGSILVKREWIDEFLEGFLVDESDGRKIDQLVGEVLNELR
ncbi:MAG: helix-turn-helix domain-containing protein [Deltaproteobacteria bacterium]|nr:helix-turn-helix domain-containing protein [Deltaproteobacteria bacterium]MBW2153924.1 helix-turn-helix domain-containing protein [Deltaproteobacteria bacterium]